MTNRRHFDLAEILLVVAAFFLIAATACAPLPVSRARPAAMTDCSACPCEEPPTPHEVCDALANVVGGMLERCGTGTIGDGYVAVQAGVTCNCNDAVAYDQAKAEACAGELRAPACFTVAALPLRCTTALTFASPPAFPPPCF